MEAIHLSRLALAGFRNYASAELALEPGLSVFEGENGHGKSNLLEAAYLLAIAKSPRASNDRELVNWGRRSIRRPRPGCSEWPDSTT